jgi:hypothetical protein
MNLANQGDEFSDINNVVVYVQQSSVEQEVKRKLVFENHFFKML